MFRLLLLCTATVLVGSASAADVGGAKGYLRYAHGNTVGTHIVTEKCAVLDLEGTITGAYELGYNKLGDVTSGCAFLYKGPNIRNCEGSSDKSVKIGETLKLAKSDGHYWGVTYAASC